MNGLIVHGPHQSSVTRRFKTNLGLVSHASGFCLQSPPQVSVQQPTCHWHLSRRQFPRLRPDARASCSDSPQVLSQAGIEPYPTENSNLQSLGPSTYAPIRVRQSKGSDTLVFRPVQAQAEDLRDVMVEMSEERNQAQKRSQSREPSVSPPETLQMIASLWNACPTHQMQA